jgi:hypothetical protein
MPYGRHCGSGLRRLRGTLIHSPPACGRRGYLNRMRPESELGRQVAVDFESDADFHKCGSCPVHSCLQFHNNQQPKLGDVWWQEGGGAAF